MTYDGKPVLVAGSLILAAHVKGATGLGFPLIATPVTLPLDVKTILIIPSRPSTVLS